jgi:hypothetical protein
MDAIVRRVIGEDAKDDSAKGKSKRVAESFHIPVSFSENRPT